MDQQKLTIIIRLVSICNENTVVFVVRYPIIIIVRIASITCQHKINKKQFKINKKKQFSNRTTEKILKYVYRKILKTNNMGF